MIKLKVTDKKTGDFWIEENHPHSWSKLAIMLINRYPDYHLIYCDIECLAKGQTWKCKDKDNLKDWYVDEQWYILDEIGRYEPLPDEIVVEEVKA